MAEEFFIAVKVTGIKTVKKGQVSQIVLTSIPPPKFFRYFWSVFLKHYKTLKISRNIFRRISLTKIDEVIQSTYNVISSCK